MEEQFSATIRQKIVDSQARPFPVFTRRDTRIPAIPGKAVAVIGMRRAGKTTLLQQIMQEHEQEGMRREEMLYFSFEDERLGGMRSGDLHLVIEEYYRLHPGLRDRTKALFCFDEIQVVPGWDTFVRRILDSEQCTVFLSGSSARMLSREVGTSMRGRAVEAAVYPFSFREYLRHRDLEPTERPERWTKAVRSTLRHELGEYLVYGGFPESLGVRGRDRMELLKSYVDVALLRDVIERYEVSNPTALRWLVRRLLANPAGSFSINRFHNDLKSQGITAGRESVYDYLGYLEDASLLSTVPISTTSERRRMVNPRKVYPVDTGLIDCFDRSGKANTGHALETCVYLELCRRGHEVAYVRTGEGYEVDFHATDPEGNEMLIQVCATAADRKTLAREVCALGKAAEEHPRAELLLITMEPPEGKELSGKVRAVPAEEWLLEE
ncbi:ATP-binding protein [Chlorobium sp. N1]|uniref:ATP-binding protein n=1 Tax=Chlorobium sp. N1 TaxID=2491138 RepID=UPI001F608B5B|nr:ATP-binding protein [Chlorobium sp. N1]